MSMLYEHMSRYYSELDSLAEDEKQDSGHTLRIFRGKVVSAYRSLEIPQSYYSKVRSGLIDMGCISILQQGARGTDSVVALHHAPDAKELKHIQSGKDLTPRLDVAILAQRVDDLSKLIGGVNIPEAISDLATAHRELQREVRKLGETAPQPARRIP